MTEKNKLKINIVDLLVVLVIIILIVAAYIKFNKFNAKTEESSLAKLVYTINVLNVRDFTAEAFYSGDIVYDSLSGVNIGTIQKVEKSNAITYEVSETGEVVEIENPYRKDLVLYIETPGSVENDAYYANKSIELKVNSQKAIDTKYIKTSGIISGINIK